MILIMLVTLYTSRVILAALGVDDYGIYTVVAGFVSLFTVISGSLSAGISRFITFELGKESENKCQEVFNTSVVVQIVLFISILLIAETIGLWFINNKLNVSPASLTAVNWVYQLSLITFLFNLLSVPYNATIIAHERMSAFAYISIIEVTLKLLIAFSIAHISSNKLIIYALCLMLVSVAIRFVYAIYCNRHFEECKLTFSYNRGIFKQILAFSGWNFFGAASAALRDQGVNVLFNLFFGSVVNAAKGVSEQVNNALNALVQNFVVALNPQIIKSYAINDMDTVFSLAFRGARFSYYIMFIPSIAIILNINPILSFWLKDVPDFTAIFIQLLIIRVLIDNISNTLITIMLASGKIKQYQIIVGGMQLMNFPLSYLALKLGAPPQSAFYIAIVVAIMCFILRLIMLKQIVPINIKSFFSNVMSRIFLVTMLSCVILIPVKPFISDSTLGMFLYVTICLLISTLLAFYLGCSQYERTKITNKVMQVLQSKLILHK
ncbi:MAG: lipopolysaccharide biosynthesis protein [Bacteroides sp.]|nr:lipopolysaccharide biosynthesis protein [Bacteroides sp.]